VKSALLADHGTQSQGIKVETRKDTAPLSGFVESQACIDNAIERMLKVEGSRVSKMG